MTQPRDSSPEPAPPLWLTEEDVSALVSLEQAIPAVRDAYLRSGKDEVTQLPKTHVASAGHGPALHAIGALAVQHRLAVAKAWTHTSRGATPLLLAWDSDTGNLIAVIEAFALGQLRTSAISGVATALLADERSEVVGIVGTGRQAEGQIAAVAAVCKVQTIKVFSPTPAHRAAFAHRIADHSGITTMAVGSAEEALDQAAVVITVTRARQPFVTPAMLTDGVHINAVGAVTPERAELQPAVVRAAHRVVVDDVKGARRLAPRELAAEYAPHVLSLAEILARADSRPASRRLTIFKAIGSGVSDLAIAELVIARASATGRGRPITSPTTAPPRFWRS